MKDCLTDTRLPANRRPKNWAIAEVQSNNSAPTNGFNCAEGEALLWTSLLIPEECTFVEMVVTWFIFCESKHLTEPVNDSRPCPKPTLPCCSHHFEIAAWNLGAPVKGDYFALVAHLGDWRRPPPSEPVWAHWKFGRIAAMHYPDYAAVINSPRLQAPTFMCNTWSFVSISLAHCLLGKEKNLLETGSLTTCMLLTLDRGNPFDQQKFFDFLSSMLSNRLYTVTTLEADDS